MISAKDYIKIERYCCSKCEDCGNALSDIEKKLGQNFPKILLEVFPSRKVASIRELFIQRAASFCRNNEYVITLCKMGCRDKSKKVRLESYAALAIAQDKECLGFLYALTLYAEKDEHDYIDRAVRSIENENHNIYFDPEETGLVKVMIK
ncbi:MAG: hypothetical protein AAGL17_14340 [Cyanobacteria bacterium J06576_12]